MSINAQSNDVQNYQTDKSRYFRELNAPVITAKAVCFPLNCASGAVSVVGLCGVTAAAASAVALDKSHCCFKPCLGIVFCGLSCCAVTTVGVTILIGTPVVKTLEYARTTATNSAIAKAAKAKAKADAAQEKTKGASERLAAKKQEKKSDEEYKEAVKIEKQALTEAVKLTTVALRQAEQEVEICDFNVDLVVTKLTKEQDKQKPSRSTVNSLVQEKRVKERAYNAAQGKWKVAVQAANAAQQLKELFDKEHPFFGKSNVQAKEKEEAIAKLEEAEKAMAAVAPLPNAPSLIVTMPEMS